MVDRFDCHEWSEQLGCHRKESVRDFTESKGDAEFRVVLRPRAVAAPRAEGAGPPGECPAASRQLARLL